MTVEMNGSKNEEKKYDESEYDEDEDFYLNINDNRFFSQKVKLDIVKSPNDSFQLVEILYAEAIRERMQSTTRLISSIHSTQNEGTKKLDRHFTLNQDEKNTERKKFNFFCVFRWEQKWNWMKVWSLTFMISIILKMSWIVICWTEPG